MKKTISTLVLLINLLAFQSLYAFTNTYQVKQEDIHKGFVIEKIPLNEAALPQVTISGISYTPVVALPAGGQLSAPDKIQVTMGMERKKSFAIVRIPAYTAGSEAGKVNQVSSFTLNIEETNAKNPAAKTTDVTTSALSTGTWYKIAITHTGFYKIDYDFIKNNLGVNPATVNPANIHIAGNGGNMLSEDNSVPRPTDLIENAIQVNGNGDNVFDNGESVVFYAVGTTAWNKDSVNQRFVHLNNLYADTAYYFITFGNTAGLRIAQQAATAAGNVDVTSFNYYAVHDTDLINPPALGKNWYGEQFIQQLGTNSQTFSFNLASQPVNDSLFCSVSFASFSAKAGCVFDVSVNGGSIGSSYFITPTSGDDVMALNAGGWRGLCNSQVANVGITFEPVIDAATGYLDYIELNARCNLVITGDQLSFRDWASVGPGNVANYKLAGANSNTSVWDITNRQVPVLMNGTLAGSTYTFTQDAQMLHEFAAMNSLNLYTPSYAGIVPNQNLHGSPQVDLIIVTYPDFLSQAQQLADYHKSHDNLRPIVATTTEIYNEFSSGVQDISAIRDFARMFYKRAGNDDAQMPRYLILFGGASYDYKNRIADNSNLVPVFESAESLNDLDAFSTDDFYGFLDDNENIENDNLVNVLDIGVGRLPARSTAEATVLVNKIMNYNNPSTLGPWRVSTTIVADLGCIGNGQFDPAGDHMADADSMAATVASAGANKYNQEKVYVDAIPVVSTPAGARCPNANAAIDQQVFTGTFLINYNGHGNPSVWSSERILTEDDFANWNNPNSLPFMVTATCDFGQFDHPQTVSAAEQLVLRDGGGVIVILTTTQAVYANYNHELNVQFLTAQFTRNGDGSWNTFGEASRKGKNVTYDLSHDSGEIANFRKFSLLGDPALTADFPQYSIHLDSVSDNVTLQHADTVKALGAYTLNGSLRDASGNTLTNFNGLVSVSFFDKPRNVTTISGCNSVFHVQDNLVYKGRVTVTNGLFALSFITPKDIDYYYGTGKISAYADNGVTDAAGSDTSITVGGYSDHPQLSTDPPVVKAYINDSLFRNGGITGSNTSLFVSLYDKTGINVSGNDVGHDLAAVLDGNVEAPYILNNYYETDPNTYQQGYVSFPVNGLADGAHSFTVRAWDVNDNMGEGTVNFIVVNGAVMNIQQLMNYPNPFTNTTNFVFEHNHPFEQLDVQIEIYNTAGVHVKNINETITASDSRTNEITWDGTDDHGSRLPSGVYVYRLNITTAQGFKSSAYQKLVIVR